MSYKDLSKESQKYIDESKQLSENMIWHFSEIHGDVAAPSIKALLNAFAKDIELLQHKLRDMQAHNERLEAFENSARKAREAEAAANTEALEERDE